MRPTVFLGHADEDGSRWSPRDRELAKALLIYEGSICDGCGQPAHEAQDPDREGWYNVVSVVCAGCQALAHHGAHRDSEPGERVRVELDPGYTKRS